MDIGEYESPEQIAQLVRTNWRLPYGPIQNLANTVESAGGIILRDDFGTRKLDAISQWVPGGRPLFFVNESAPGERLRFTLAHEIGHSYLSDVSLEEFCSVYLKSVDEQLRLRLVK